MGGPPILDLADRILAVGGQNVGAFAVVPTARGPRVGEPPISDLADRIPGRKRIPNPCRQAVQVMYKQ